jgi:hypothetical protein
MPVKKFTFAQDKALFVQIESLPILKVTAAILFILLRENPNRDDIIAQIKSAA